MIQEPGLMTSQLRFLQPPSMRNIRNTNAVSNLNQTTLRTQNELNITQSIFFRSIRCSNIGRIAGKEQQIVDLDHDEITPSIEQQQEEKKKKPRINFSSYKQLPDQVRNTALVAPKDNIFKMTESHMGNESQKDMKDELAIEDPDDVLMIVSFQGKNNKDLLNGASCGMCNKGGPPKCKLQMVNQTLLQVYLPNKDKQGVYDLLLFSVNFDTLKLKLACVLMFLSRVLVNPYNLLLRHSKPEVVKKWHAQLETMCLQSKGIELSLSSLLQVDEFYQRRYETQAFFAKNTQTGDILLFQDTHFFAKAQRFFTRSDFDHVAVVVRDNNYGVLMFESMTGGVTLTPWRSVIRHGWYQSIPRQMFSERDKAFFETVEKFVKDNLQKSYHISLQKLTAAQSFIRNPSDPTDEQKQKNGFFCSQLVATLYKDLGLLTREKKDSSYKPGCNFIPKDFSTNSERKLNKGKLSPEYDIFFDKQLLKQSYKNLIK